jgi:hypothetical protein
MDQFAQPWRETSIHPLMLRFAAGHGPMGCFVSGTNPAR